MLNKGRRKRARKELGESTFRRIADRLGFYVIVARDDVEVVTISHRCRRRWAV